MYRIKKVPISDNIEMGTYVFFSGCKDLQEVKIQYGIKKINEGTFSECTRLKEVTIPNRFAKIADDAFDRFINVTLQ